MMKKFGIIFTFVILAFSFSVKAEDDAEIFMEIDCGNNYNITSEKSLSCEGNFVYEKIAISDIEFTYQTNLDIKFTEVSGFPLTKNGNKISIHATTPLYDEIQNGEVIVKFTLSANSNVGEKESLTFQSFKINNSSDVEIEDATETFNVEAPIALDSNCFLDSITIDKELISGFDKNKLEYSGIIVSSNVVFVDATRSSEKATVTGLGQVEVQPGKTITHIITVTAEDNTKKEYKLTMTNKNTEANSNDEDNIEPVSELSKDNTLKTLELLNGKEKINFTFDSKKDTYNIKIEEMVEKIIINATLNDSTATFVDQYGPRDVKLKEGDNKVLIKVKAADGNIKVYTLNIVVKDNRNKDTSLKSLKINGEVINLIDKIYKYEIKVAKNVLKTEIEALATSSLAKVDYQDIELSPGDNSVVISVIAENGDKKDYTINVIQSEEDEIDNSLQNITIDGYDLGFSKDKKNYVLKVSNDTDNLKIILKPSNLEYEVLGNSDLEDGSIITIKIADEEYEITIKKDTNEISPVVFIITGIVALSLVVVIIYLIRKKKNSIEII